MTAKRPVRCAVYTRVSTSEGLDMAFNSLDAQREACEAYILSQKTEGWIVLKERFDDGGFSGGNMERPALKRLLAATEAGAIDVVVVYKIDRLSRSLVDFAKLIELFDRKSVTFASTTQQFSTVSSMGRLTLNILLSFAQFEREVAGERIRDKIAASKKKGIWMGGNPPLGYDVANRKLMINAAEAETVRFIFQRYLELGSARLLLEELARRKIHTKRRTFADDRVCGGKPFDRASLLTMLRNRTYLGETTHKGRSYRGEHEAIVAKPLFSDVQIKLDEHEPTFRRRSAVPQEALFADILFDECGERMSPNYARKGGVHYRYYVSYPTLKGRHSDARLTRLPAPQFEEFVAGVLKRLGLDEIEMRALLHRLVVHSHKLALSLDRDLALSECRSAGGASGRDKDVIGHLRTRLMPGEDLLDVNGRLELTLPVRAQFRGGRASIVFPESEHTTPTPDLALIKALARAHRWRTLLLSGEAHSIDEVARRHGLDRGHTGLTLKLAFLSPNTARAILLGEQPSGLRLSDLLSAEIPTVWSEQDAALSNLASMGPQSSLK